MADDDGARLFETIYTTVCDALDIVREDKAVGVGKERLGSLFVPYAKIGTSWGGAKKKTRKVKDWVATEKVHGANMQLISDGVSVVPCKRTSVLGDDEPFFDLEPSGTLDQLSVLARDLASRIVSSDDTIVAIAICGELAGGDPPVQQGVFYSPTLVFYVFDLAALREDAPPEFLPFDQAMELAGSAGFLCAEPLATGSYQELLGFNLDFPTTLPSRLGLDVPIDALPNTAEGIVIRPAVASAPRALVKAKGTSFAEVERAGHDHIRTLQQASSASSTLEEPWRPLWYELQCFLTSARMDGARGKLGSAAELELVLAYTIADAICDWTEADPDALPLWTALTSHSRTSLIQEAANLLR